MVINGLTFETPDLAEQYGLALLDCGDISGGRAVLQLAWNDQAWLLRARQLLRERRVDEARLIIMQVDRARQQRHDTGMHD